jgi:hypothetical protein
MGGPIARGIQLKKWSEMILTAGGKNVETAKLPHLRNCRRMFDRQEWFPKGLRASGLYLTNIQGELFQAESATFVG